MLYALEYFQIELKEPAAFRLACIKEGVSSDRYPDLETWVKIQMALI